MWADWEAIRQLTHPSHNPATISLAVIGIPDTDVAGVAHANALHVVNKLCPEHAWEVSSFARFSLEHFYFLPIPAHYIESRQVLELELRYPDYVVRAPLTTSGTARSFPKCYFSTSQPEDEIERHISDLVFQTTDRFQRARRKITIRKAVLMAIDEVDTLVGSQRQMYVVPHSSSQCSLSLSDFAFQVDEVKSLDTMMQSLINTSGELRNVIRGIEGSRRDRIPETQASV
jgi:hypothetical protein